MAQKAQQPAVTDLKLGQPCGAFSGIHQEGRVPVLLHTFQRAAWRRNCQLAAKKKNPKYGTTACRCPTMHWASGGHPRHLKYHVSPLLTVLLGSLPAKMG